MNWNESRGPTGPRRNKLYRNREDGLIAGICAGLADYFGFDLTITRVIVGVGTMFFPSILVVYVILAIVLDARPSQLREPGYDEELARHVRAEPHATLNSVKHRFRDLDLRLQRIEKYVTSQRFKLDREFEGLRD